MNPKVNKILKGVRTWLSPEQPGATPLVMAQARALTERNRFVSLLNYRDFDEKDNLSYLDDGSQLSIAFGLLLAPLVMAGTDSETQIEAAINACPADTILQFGVLSSPQIKGFVNTWVNSRLSGNTNPLLEQIAMRRREFMLTTATGPSMLPKTRLHPRMMQYYLFARVPFKGDLFSEGERLAFIKSMKDLRNTIQGALTGAQISSDEMTGDSLRFLLRELLNPHLDPAERLATSQRAVPLHEDLLDRNCRITVQDDGTIGFAGAAGEPEVYLSSITTDAAPREFYLPWMAQTLGDPTARDERITCPYWAYTTIHVLDAENAKDTLTTKLGVLNKQTMSESPWYRSMMRHLYDRRDMASMLSDQTRNGHRLVRAYSGINLYTPRGEIREQVESVKGLWRAAGFRVSEERYISFPVFLASLPMQYSPAMDPPNKGMQRAQLMHSLNAASMIPIQGDWSGTGPARALKDDGSVEKYGAGPLMVSRRGQLACFDLLQTSVNYNFVIIAASGSGKSFLANEIVCDFLSKGGIARIIDVGKSYFRFCSVMGGQNVIFSRDNPMSMNPFSDLRSQDDLDELMPMLQDLLRQMMYPMTEEKDVPPWEYKAIGHAINAAFEVHGSSTDLKDVHRWLADHDDPRAKDMAFLLNDFAHGRYSRWFTGPRTVSFNNPLVVIELEELKQDPQLQAVVMTLVIHQVTKEMYLSDRKIPKLLAIDEAWDLLSGMRTGKFIETSFRRARKYNGIAGVITQSFEDFERSGAAKAAIENAEWQFILYQRPESLAFALKNQRVIGDEQTHKLLSTVQSGPGYSEVYVKSSSAGAGLYRFVTDRHSYYTFTTKPADINRIDSLTAKGKSIAEAIDVLAREDYQKMWGFQLAA
ncbi:TraC family protein [Paraburkholderia sp. UCT31]|uniref:TraC family protein n=1 Tax=Paraburkholderia sp. UCT31 TaxID=2615209 RepID=UPI0016567380|nr:TraC family protein [Paraburkholderia sp. UCT31]MBC8737239.1 TraC family protein [Paraburkholderia sp. UCT31]